MEPLNRKLKVLAVLVEKYISTGEPVGSKSICEEPEFSFSSATIRSEMAALSELGYLCQPHVSSGRLPSDRGYRLYINKLMQKKPLPVFEKNLINGALATAACDPENLISKAAKVLAEITNCAAIVTAPLSNNARIRNIKFVKISRRNAMIVLMTTTGMVKNRLFRCEYDITPEMLELFERILNEKFKGEFLSLITPENVGILIGSDSEIIKLISPVIDVLMEACKDACKLEVKIEGRKNILNMHQVNSETLMNIFEFLENENSVIELLNFEEHGIKFAIGDENLHQELKGASVVSAHYGVGQKWGSMAVMGPTRMDYSSIAAKLEYVSALLGVILERMLDIR